MTIGTDVLSYEDVAAILSNAGDALATVGDDLRPAEYFSSTAILFDLQITDQAALNLASEGLAALRAQFDLHQYTQSALAG